MKLIQTSLTATTVRMRYADDADAAKAQHWIDFQVPLSELKRLSETPLGDPELRALGEVRLTALRYVRGIVGDETQRLAQLLNRIRE